MISVIIDGTGWGGYARCDMAVRTDVLLRLPELSLTSAVDSTS